MHLGLHSRTLKGLRRVPAFWSATNDLEKIVATHTGHVMNKWKHYFEVYDRHLARFRGRNITLLEIGVAGGGSLEVWRRYFGPKTRIYGVDVNPDCKRFESPGTRVIIGNQGDTELLERLAAETGPIDILIDDGSHAYKHQLATFRTLFSHMTDDGVYACEDICTSYYKEEFGGGLRQPGTFVEFLKDLVDETNAWFWRESVDTETDNFTKTLYGIHFYPALVVIEKRMMQPPMLTPVGRTRELMTPPTPVRS